VSAALLAGLLLGDRADLPPALDETFRLAGVYHILAVSGFNVALLTSGVFGVLGLVRIPRRVAAAIAIVAAIGFALIVGGGPSVLRATAMAVLILAAIMIGRESSLLNSVALAGLVILIIRPADLAEPGFQLSFAATLGIIIFAAPFGAALSARGCPRRLAEAVGVSLAAQVSIAPILLHHFNQISLFAVAANLLVVPLAAFATVVGMLAVITAGISALLSGPLFDGIWPVLLALRAVVFLAARVPAGTLHLPAPPWTATLTFYGGLAALAMAACPLTPSRRAASLGPRPGCGPPSSRDASVNTPQTHDGTRGPGGEPQPGFRACADATTGGHGDVGRTQDRPSPQMERSGGRARLADMLRRDARARRILCSGLRAQPWIAATFLITAAALVETWPLARPPRARLRVAVLDVGQGDAIALEFPDGRAALIDAGTGGATRFDIGERVIAPYLWNRGVRRLALIVQTHGDLDHAGGIPAVLRHFGATRAWSPDHEPPSAPVFLAGVGVTPLGRPRPRITGSARGLGADRNNNSLVLRLDYGLASFLLAADIEDEAERQLLARGAPVRAHVLKVAHHGGRSSSGGAFLARVSPSVAVVSVGARNPFGHPAETTLDRLRRAGARLYRTDRDGAVIMETDGRDLTVTRWATRRTERIPLPPLPRTPKTGSSSRRQGA
jgi:competence protein ComEC